MKETSKTIYEQRIKTENLTQCVDIQWTNTISVYFFLTVTSSRAEALSRLSEHLLQKLTD